MSRKWNSIFPNPDEMASPEYQAIHDMLVATLLNTSEYPGELEIPEDVELRIRGILDGFKGWVDRLSARLVPESDDNPRPGMPFLAPVDAANTPQAAGEPSVEPEAPAVPLPEAEGIQEPVQPERIAMKPELEVYTGEGPLAPERLDDGVILTVIAHDVAKLQGSQAKAVAFEARKQFGMLSAGITKFEGPLPLNDRRELDTAAKPAGQSFALWGVRFKLTASLS